MHPVHQPPARPTSTHSVFSASLGQIYATHTCWCNHDTMGSFTTKTSFDTAKLCRTTALQPYLSTCDHPTQPRQVVKYLKSCSTVYFIWDPHNLEWFSDTQFMQHYDITSTSMRGHYSAFDHSSHIKSFPYHPKFCTSLLYCSRNKSDTNKETKHTGSSLLIQHLDWL